jgi:protein phosphatase
MEIRIPDPGLVILCGPAACGKSTFARRHFRETQTVSSDRCRGMLWDDEAKQDASHFAFELMHTIIDKRLTLRRLTVADSTALAPEARKKLREIARRHDAPCVLIAFDLPLDELERRDASRERQVGREILQEHQAKFAQARERFAHEGYAAWWRVEPGVEPVVLRLKKPVRLRIGALGTFRFPAGYYLYVGSALNGLEGRVRRHLRRNKICRWHIDYLRRRAEVLEVWTVVSKKRLECRWAAAARKMPGASIPAPRFGASDCRCAAHLVHLPGISRRIRKQVSVWPVTRKSRRS